MSKRQLPSGIVHFHNHFLLSYPFLRALYLFITSWVIGLIILGAIYCLILRDFQMTWGATSEEIARIMPGDELLESPTFDATRVVKIEAAPEDIWPWLVQMGYNRAGFYTFGGLDAGSGGNSETLLPEFQDLAVGDKILPILTVISMDTNHTMLWVFDEHNGPWSGATWCWGLYPTNDGHTRLVSRLRQDIIMDSLPSIIGWIIMDPLEIAMMRTTMLGIKRRVEQYQPNDVNGESADEDNDR